MVGKKFGWILRNTVFFLVLGSLLTLSSAQSAEAQATGSIEGTVRKADDSSVLGGVTIIVVGTGVRTTTDTQGRFSIPRIATGQQVLLFRWLGFQPQQVTVTVNAGAAQTIDVEMTPRVVMLGEIMVEGASRTPERIVEAPAAISVIDPVTIRDKSPTGQAPTVLNQVPGVDVVQSGVNDFNVNARGFNSSLNRRVLVLQDGRDLSVAFLGSQEWNSMSLPLEDISRIEMVRGPGSALYGANAFSGVINITTPAARDVVGTKVSLAGGELNTMRADVRHAGTASDGRIGYRVNAGFSRSDSWTKSRTSFSSTDAISEYGAADATLDMTGVGSCPVPNCLPIELAQLSGQTRDAATGTSSGDPDPIQNIYGSARFDYYFDNGSVLTAEGGAAQIENETVVTGIGRVQVQKALRPWARLNWGSDHYNVMAWYNGRNSLDPQRSLGSGLALEESSSILHFEGQYNRSFLEDQASVILGASYRMYNVDTKGTLMHPSNDARSDYYASAYSQLEYRPTDQIRIVGAARVDNGTLFETQFSPKAAIVYSPHENHSIRGSFNRAFQTPNYSEFFLNVQAGKTPLAAQLEGGILQYYAAIQDPNTYIAGGIPAAQANAIAGLFQTFGLPNSLPWGFAANTPVMALGNNSLDVETVTGWEIGYKGNIADNAYVTLDLYYNQLSNFVTDLLWGVNERQYGLFDLANGTNIPTQIGQIDAVFSGMMLPESHPLRAAAAQLLAGYAAMLQQPITDLPGVGRALFLSYAQAGEAQEQGVEFGIGYGITPEFRVDAAFTLFDFSVIDEGLKAAGQSIDPNTPEKKLFISAAYSGAQGFDASVSAKFVESYEWNAGVFAGTVPSSNFVDLNLGYRLNNNLRFYAVGTNILDQQRFQLYGGSVIGRRMLAGATATF